MLGWRADDDVSYPSVTLLAVASGVVVGAIVLRYLSIMNNAVFLCVALVGVILALIARSRFRWEQKVLRYCQDEVVSVDPPRLALLVNREPEWEIDLRIVKAIREQERPFDALPNASGKHLVFQLTNGVEVGLLIEAPIVGRHPGYGTLRRILSESGIQLA